MHQQNIIFVFLQVLKLVMEITVKVKDILRMEVRKMPALFIFALFYKFKNIFIVLFLKH